jgi:hypothetical protein
VLGLHPYGIRLPYVEQCTLELVYDQRFPDAPDLVFLLGESGTLIARGHLVSQASLRSRPSTFDRCSNRYELGSKVERSERVVPVHGGARFATHCNQYPLGRASDHHAFEEARPRVDLRTMSARAALISKAREHRLAKA